MLFAKLEVETLEVSSAILDMKSQAALWFAAKPQHAERNRGQSNVDLVVRDNYYFNVRTGIEQEFATDAGSTWKNGRVIVLRNIMQLDTTDAAMGIQLKGKTSGNYGHEQVVIRRNIIRPRDDATPFSGTKGIVVENGEEVLVENNVIELDDPNAVRHTAASSAKFKAFNNQKVNGTLLPGYNTGTSTHDGELAIDVDDVVLGL